MGLTHRQCAVLVCAAGLLWGNEPRADDPPAAYADSIQSIRRHLETELKGRELTLKITIPRVIVLGDVAGTAGRMSRRFPPMIIGGAPGRGDTVVPGDKTQIQPGTRDISGFVQSEKVSQTLAINADSGQAFVLPDEEHGGFVDHGSGIPSRCTTTIDSVRAPDKWIHPALVFRLASTVIAVKASTLSANLERLSPRSRSHAEDILRGGRSLTVLGCADPGVLEPFKEIARVAGKRAQFRGELVFLLPDTPSENPEATLARIWSLAFQDDLPVGLAGERH